MWRASASGRPFALAVLDARMPGIDGLVLAERIRQSPELAATRIILLTSDVLHGDLARYREAGDRRLCDEAGPAGGAARDRLPGALPAGSDRGARRPPGPARLRGGAAPSLAEPAASPARLRILVVEDNDFNQQLVDHLLRRRGHEVVAAADGRSALEALERQPLRPDAPRHPDARIRRVPGGLMPSDVANGPREDTCRSSR